MTARSKSRPPVRPVSLATLVASARVLALAVALAGCSFAPDLPEPEPLRYELAARPDLPPEVTEAAARAVDAWCEATGGALCPEFVVADRGHWTLGATELESWGLTRPGRQAIYLDLHRTPPAQLQALVTHELWHAATLNMGHIAGSVTAADGVVTERIDRAALKIVCSRVGCAP